MINSIKNVYDLLSQISTGKGHFPVTELFNEGWMLRLVLDWYSKYSKPNDKLHFLDGSDWFSEAQIPTYFTKGNSIQKNEARTHVDGVIGHFDIGNEINKVGLNLSTDAKQFVVIEAKMNSGLSKGIKNDPDYNQAARSIACMAETISRAGIKVSQLQSLAFYVITTKTNNRINPTFLDKKDIRLRVESRFTNKNVWLISIFEPVLNQIIIEHITFDDILTEIKSRDSDFGLDIAAFYDKC